MGSTAGRSKTWARTEASPSCRQGPGSVPAAHRPELAGHVDQMKPSTCQLADGHDVTCAHGRPGVGRRVLDLMKVSGVEMPHRSLLNLLPSAESSLDRGEPLTQFAASHNNMLPCTNRRSKLFQIKSKFFKARASRSKEIQTFPRKKAWISL